MPKTLWIVNHYASTPDRPGGTRHYWLSRYLNDASWDTYVIAATPPSADGTPVTHDQMTWVRAPWRGGRGARRIAGWGAFSAAVVSGLPTRRLPMPDVVLGSTVHLGAAWAAQSVARRRGVPFVFEVRDLWPETLIALGAIGRDSPAAKAMFRLERRLATQAALIVSPLPNAAEYFTRFHGVPESRVLWLSNGVNCALDPDLRISQPPAAGTGNSFRLQYFGSLGRTNYVEVLLRSMALAIRQTSKNLQLNVYGDGPLRKPLSALVTELGLDDHVSFMEPIPQEAVRSESQRGDALAFVVGDHPDLYRYGISMNKMFDYLAAGRWILMGANVPFNPLADAPGCTITDATPEALAEGLVTLAEMPLALRESGARANMDLARDRYDYRYLAQVLAERLDRIITPMDTQ